MFRAFDRLTLKLKITMFTLVVFFVTIWVLAQQIVTGLRHDVGELLAQQQQAQTAFMAERIGHALQMHIDALSIVSLAITPKLLADRPLLEAVVAQRHARSSSLGLLVLDRSGRPLLTVPPAAARTDYSQADFFLAALESRGGAALSMMVSAGPLAADPHFVIALPVRDRNGRIIAVVAEIVGLQQSKLFAELGHAGFPEATRVMVFARGAQQLLGASVPDQVLVPADRARYLAQRTGTGLLHGPQAEEEMVSVLPVAGSDWVVVSAMPASAAFSSFEQMKANIYRVSLALSLLTGLLLWLFLRRELSPLSRTADLIDNLSSGKVPTLRLIPLEGSAEIRKLQLSFNHLQKHLLEDEEDLREEEALYHSMFSSNTAVKLLIDPADGAIVDANPSALAYYGWSLEELRNMRITDINILPPDAVQREMQLATTEQKRFFRFRHRLASGEVREVEIHSGSVRYHNRTLLYSIVSDVTEREQALHREQVRSEVLEMLARGTELNMILNAIVLQIEAEQPQVLCSILLLSADGKQLRVGAAPSLPESFLKAQPDSAACSALVSGGKRLIVDDIQSHPLLSSCKEFAARAGLNSVWSEPIFSSRGHILGALLLYLRAASVPTPAQLKLVEEISRVVSIAIERKQVEEELQLASTVFRASPEAIVITDPANRIVAVNPAFTRITQYLPQEAIGNDPKLLSSGQQGADFYRAMWHDIQTHGKWQGEIVNRRKSGETYSEWLNIHSVYGDDGQVRQRIAIFSDITDKKRSEEIIWRQANYDTLTGLPNRRLFHDRLMHELKREEREQQPLALMFIDLDHFKEINDTLGHEAGDNLLMQAAQRIAGCIRESDTLARLGGDEFTVILPGLADTQRLGALADNIIHALARPFLIGEATAYVSASIGITLYPLDADNLSALLKNADQAMYAAKSKGRNQYSYFTASMQEAAQARLLLSNDLRHAIGKGQFDIYYQPIVELASGLPTKAEALLRWRHPARGFVSPSLFIPLAEEIGLINDIGNWVFRQAALKAKQWNTRSNGRLPMQISVNKSPRQFISDEDNRGLLDWLRQLDIPPSCIVVEITEGLLMDDRPEVQDKLLAFRDAGIQVSLDDFGTGYSAMSYLQRFDIDYIKIDQSFVRNMERNAGDHAIAEAIIVMAHKLGIKVIAEGVETPQQRDMLAAAGCDYGQGFLFSVPLPADEFDRYLDGCTLPQTG